MEGGVVSLDRIVRRAWYLGIVGGVTLQGCYDVGEQLVLHAAGGAVGAGGTSTSGSLGGSAPLGGGRVASGGSSPSGGSDDLIAGTVGAAGAETPGGSGAGGSPTGSGGVTGGSGVGSATAGGATASGAGAGGAGAGGDGDRTSDWPTECGPETIPCPTYQFRDAIIYYNFFDDADAQKYGSWKDVTEGPDGKVHSGPADRLAIQDAMLEWTMATDDAIRFVETAPEPQPRQIWITNSWGAGCGITTLPNERLIVVRLRQCSRAAMVHTLGHLIGLEHPHQRPDRDRYLQVRPQLYCSSGSESSLECKLGGMRELSFPADENYCGFGSSSKYRSQVFLENAPRCEPSDATDRGPFDFSSIMLAGSGPFATDCASERPESCGRTRRDGTSEGAALPPVSTVTLADASRAVQFVRQPRWSGFRPILRADGASDEPLHLELAKGVSVVGSPALSRWESVGLLVVARGSNNHYYAKYNLKGTADWPRGDWEDLGGDFVSDPAVVSWGPGHLDLVGVSTQGKIVHRMMDNGVLEEEDDIIPPPNSDALSAPAVASWGVDRLDVVIRSGSHIFYNSLEPSLGWPKWVDLGGDFVGKPALTTRGTGVLELMASKSDYRLWQRTFASGAWSTAFTPLDGLQALETSFALASRGADDLSVTALNGSRLLWHRSWARAWSDWEVVGGVPEGSPATVKTSAGIGHCVIAMTDNGKLGLWSRTWN